MSTDIVLTRDESRRIDPAAVDELKLTGTVLMENAARGVAEIIQQRYASVDEIVIVCGPGNNGGDGFAIARQLGCHERVAEVWLVTAGKQLADDAAFNNNAWKKCGQPVHDVDDDAMPDLRRRLADLSDRSLIVDCLLGTGIRGAPKEPFATAIDAMNDSAAAVLAVDVPSGLDCDTGEAAGSAVRADTTVTFVANKQGFQTDTGRRHTGEIHVAHIGLPVWWIEAWLKRYRSGSSSDADEGSAGESSC
ncbi:MAG: NAD(P)H-hydrate epimerase [Fuerstiella sp.]